MATIDFEKLFEGFMEIKVGEARRWHRTLTGGDMWKEFHRKAPVPVVELDKKEYRIGGQSPFFF